MCEWHPSPLHLRATIRWEHQQASHQQIQCGIRQHQQDKGDKAGDSGGGVKGDQAAIFHFEAHADHSEPEFPDKGVECVSEELCLVHRICAAD